jgi:hypothetical protein
MAIVRPEDFSTMGTGSCCRGKSADGGGGHLPPTPCSTDVNNAQPYFHCPSVILWRVIRLPSHLLSFKAQQQNSGLESYYSHAYTYLFLLSVLPYAQLTEHCRRMAAPQPHLPAIRTSTKFFSRTLCHHPSSVRSQTADIDLAAGRYPFQFITVPKLLSSYQLPIISFKLL